MPGNKSSEESQDTFKSILAPLSNDTRLKIFKIIGKHQPISYSQILEKTGLESGSFYWHVSKMNHLVAQDNEKRYVLTDKGKAAYLLMTDEKIVDEKETQVKIEETEKKLLNLAKIIYGVSWKRGLFELFLLLLVWAYSLAKIKAITFLIITETYTNPSFYLIFTSPILSISALVIIARIMLYFLGALRIVQPKTSLRIRFKGLFSLDKITWTAISFTPFLILPLIVSLIGGEYYELSSLVTAIISFIELLFFFFLHSLYLMYFEKLSLKDSFLVSLSIAYILLGFSFLFFTYKV